MTENRCPDCGCPLESHNAVNFVPEPIAHCGGCGTCWKTKGTDYVQKVIKMILEAQND